MVTTSELSRWWLNTSESDWLAYGPKAEEYGADDLIWIGRCLGELMGWDVTEAEAEYLGCWFYELGKMARIRAALGRHELPSHDTDHDMTVYSMMARKARKEQT